MLPAADAAKGPARTAFSPKPTKPRPAL